MDEKFKRIGQVTGVWMPLAGMIGGSFYFKLLPGWVVGLFSLWVALSYCVLVVAQDRPARNRLIEFLEHPRFRHGYEALVWPIFKRFWRRLAKPLPKGAGPFRAIRGALTWKTYDLALLLAVAYPILSMVMVWLVFGEAAKLGGETIFEATGFWNVWPERAVVLGVLVSLIAGVIGRKLAAASPQRFVRSAAGGLPLVALSAAVVVAIALTEAFAFQVAFAVTFTFTITIAVSFGFAASVSDVFAGALVVAFAFAVTFVEALREAVGFTFTFAVAGGGLGLGVGVGVGLGAAVSLDEKGQHGVAWMVVTFLLPIGWIAAMRFVDWGNVDAESKAIFLFLGVFPLINAVFDALSYAVTLGLIRLGLRTRRWFGAALAGVADLAVACLLFLALGVALTAIVAALNHKAGVDFVDLGVLFADIRENPLHHGWVFLMLFSTLLPTGVHLVLSLLGWQSLVPPPLRRYAARHLRQEQATLSTIIAPLLAGLCLTLPLWGALGLGWGLWHYGAPAIGHFFDGYFTLLLRIAHGWVGAF